MFFGTPVGIKVHHDRDLRCDQPARGSPNTSRRPRSASRSWRCCSSLIVWQWGCCAAELHDRHRQGLFAERHPARLDALGDLRDLHRCSSSITDGAAGRPAPARLVLPVLRLLQLDMLTLDHYARSGRTASSGARFGNTMLLGLLGATATMVLGSIVAYITVRTQVARPAPDRRPRLAAVDDAGHGARRRLPVGLRPAAGGDPDLRHDLGAVARLSRARHAGRGARDVGRLCADRPTTSRNARASTARAGCRRWAASWWRCRGRPSRSAGCSPSSASCANCQRLDPALFDRLRKCCRS